MSPTLVIQARQFGTLFTILDHTPENRMRISLVCGLQSTTAGPARLRRMTFAKYRHLVLEATILYSCRDSVSVTEFVNFGDRSNTTQQVASSDQTFSSTPTDPPYHYHSIYDSQMWQETYADPGFHRHVRVNSTPHSTGLIVSLCSGCTCEDFGSSYPSTVRFDYRASQYHRIRIATRFLR